MPDERERMNYDAVGQMAAECKNTANQLTQATTAMSNIAKALEGGALLGQGGDALRTAIIGKLLPRLKQLDQKMLELKRDLDNARLANADGVRTAQQRFR